MPSGKSRPLCSGEDGLNLRMCQHETECCVNNYFRLCVLELNNVLSLQFWLDVEEIWITKGDGAKKIQVMICN